MAATIAHHPAHLRDDALRHGADPHEVTRAVAALRIPEHQVHHAQVDLGEVMVTITHPGPGHTGHDLIVVVAVGSRTVVFCGDLVEESGDPVGDEDSDLAAWPTTLDRVIEAGGPDAIFVPGHGALVDARFVERQQRWRRGAV